MKNLVLCRHAKSSWKYLVDDLYRPLNKRGLLQAPVIAMSCALKPDLVLCSPAVRAWSTAVCYFNDLNWNYQILRMEPLLHETSAHTIVSLLKKLPESNQTVFVFGHNPGFNDVIDYLDQAMVVHPNLVTSGRVLMQLNIEKWAQLHEACGSITDWATPANLE